MIDRLKPREYNQPHFGVMASGISGNLGGWDVDDDFTSYANDTAFDVAYPVTSSEYQGNAATDDITVIGETKVGQAHGRVYHDLTGAVIDDTAWVCRYAVDITLLTTVSAASSINSYYGISDKIQAPTTGTEDFLGHGLENKVGSLTHRGVYADGATLTDLANTTSTQTFARALTVEKVWLEQIRLSSTSFTDELFSDAYSSSLEKETMTVLSTTVNLRYWKAGNNINGYTTDTLKTSATVDPSLQFADGVTTAP